MSLKKRKVFLILIGILLFIFYCPYNNFKADTFIEIQNKLNDKNINGSTSAIKIHHKGISWNEKEIDLKKDHRFTVKNSSVLSLVIYSKLTLELTLQRVVDKEIIETNVKAESIIWGLGSYTIKNNSFNESIIKTIDELYSGNKFIK